MRLSLDTNVLVYAANADDPDRHRRALWILDRAIDADGVVALQCLAELFNVLTRRKTVSPARARTSVRDMEANFHIAYADESCLHEAMAAVADHSFSFWDAMLWATVRAAGCEVLLTEDLRDGRTLGGVTLLNPFDPKNDERLADVLAG